MMKKRILMLSSTWDISFIIKILHGMEAGMHGEDVELITFNAYDEELISEDQDMERHIYFLPDADMYDAVLLCVNSVGCQKTVEELAYYYKNKGIPVLSIEVKLDGIPFIGINHEKAMYELVEHMIKVHGCATFNYVGGPADHYENQERYRGFTKCLEKYGLQLDTQRILHLSFLEKDGRKAYRYFREKNLHLPDAVICANDHMALGYCMAAAEDGYQVPGDVRVTGYDNLFDAQKFAPSITSINRKWFELGRESMSAILEMIDGLKKNLFDSDFYLQINESCGCCVNDRNIRSDLREVYQKKIDMLQMHTLERKSRKLIGRSDDLAHFQKRLQDIKRLGNIEEIAICMNASLLQETTEQKFEYDNEINVLTADCIYPWIKKKGLLPPELTSRSKIYIVSPLHFNKINLGYCVMSGLKEWSIHLDHRTLIESLSLGLEGVRQHIILKQANERLNQLYVRDAMTEMYNRYGYNQYARKLYKQKNGKIFAMYLDLDNLKKVNDTYGHVKGDTLISAMAQIILEVFSDQYIRVRMGGDEFLVVGEYQNEEMLRNQEKEIHEHFQAYAESQRLAVPLSVSIGIDVNPDGDKTLDQIIQCADQRMYIQKQSRKNE